MLGVREPVKDAPYWEWLLPDHFGEARSGLVSVFKYPEI